MHSQRCAPGMVVVLTVLLPTHAWFVPITDDFRPGNLSAVLPGVKVHRGFLNQFASLTTSPDSGQWGDCLVAVSMSVRCCCMNLTALHVSRAGLVSFMQTRLLVCPWVRLHGICPAAAPMKYGTSRTRPPCAGVTPTACRHSVFATPLADANNITAVLLRLSGGQPPERLLITGHSLGAALRQGNTPRGTSLPSWPREHSPCLLLPPACRRLMTPRHPACSELCAVWASTVWPNATMLVANTGAPRVGDKDWETEFTAVVGRAYRWERRGAPYLRSCSAPAVVAGQGACWGRGRGNSFAWQPARPHAGVQQESACNSVPPDFQAAARGPASMPSPPPPIPASTTPWPVPPAGTSATWTRCRSCRSLTASARCRTACGCGTTWCYCRQGQGSTAHSQSHELAGSVGLSD